MSADTVLFIQYTTTHAQYLLHVYTEVLWFHYPGLHLMPSVKSACSYRRTRCLIRTLPAELPW